MTEDEYNYTPDYTLQFPLTSQQSWILTGILYRMEDGGMSFRDARQSFWQEQRDRGVPDGQMWDIEDDMERLAILLEDGEWDIGNQFNNAFNLGDLSSN